MRHGLSRWVFASLVTGVLCVYLVGNQTVGLFDRDEPRYAQTSRQMLQSGDWVVPRFLDRVRTAKPVLIYWCQAAAMKGLGDTRFAARLPSALAMTATVALLAVGVSRAAGRRRGLWTAFVTGSCVMATVSAKMCLTDAVLLLFVVAGQLCVYRLWRRGVDWPTAVVLGLAAGGAGLTKGPVALGVHATTAAALFAIGGTVRGTRHRASMTTAASGATSRATTDAAARAADSSTDGASGGAESAARAAASGPLDDRSRSPARGPTAGSPVASLRPVRLAFGLLVAAAVTIAVVTPWLVLVHRRAPEFLAAAVGHDVIDRVQRGQEGHGGPPGTYAVWVWGTFFPWSLLLPAAVVYGWKRRRVPAVRFALAAVAGPWVMFELIATKLPHYVLPTYPALAFLVADLIVRGVRGRVPEFSQWLFRVTVRVWGGAVALAGVAAAALLLAVDRVATPDALAKVSAGGLGVAVVAVVTGVGVARRFNAGRIAAACRLMGGGFLAVVAVLYALVLPDFAPLRLTRDVARIFKDHNGYGRPGVMIDFKEPSLAFEQGGGLREESDNDYFAHTPPADWPEWAVVSGRVWDRTDAAVRVRWTEHGRVSGVAYSDRGERYEVIVLRLE